MSSKTALFFFLTLQLNTQTVIWLVLIQTLRYSGHFLLSPGSVRRISCVAVCSIEWLMAFYYARCPEWRKMFSLSSNCLSSVIFPSQASAFMSRLMPWKDRFISRLRLHTRSLYVFLVLYKGRSKNRRTSRCSES